MAIIQTQRLTLRPASEDDLAPLHEILSNPRATAFWSTPPHSSIETTRTWLGNMIAIPRADGEDFIVEHQGRVIGKAGLYRFPEIGYILHPDSWGQGFATEALTPVIDRAFRKHLLGRIEADVDPRNVASLKLLKKLGFTRSGYREKSWYISGEWQDSIDLTLDEATWKASTAIPVQAGIADEEA